MIAWAFRSIIGRLDTWFVLTVGAACMASVARWGIFRGRSSDGAELTYAFLCPILVSVWVELTASNTLSFMLAPFIVLAFGGVFALSVVRHGHTVPNRSLGAIALGLNAFLLLAFIASACL